jgi:hypothetical protein
MDQKAVMYICEFDQLLYPTRFLNHQEPAVVEVFSLVSALEKYITFRD